MNLARLFAYTRYVEAELTSERERHAAEVAELKSELREWQNKVLLKANVTPLFYEPKPAPPVEQPPVGVTAKRSYLQRLPQSAVKSDEEILEAAAQAQHKSGNGTQH